ncbi:MAG: putative Ig domain-containing protein [Planctomycetota bacterium]
MDSGVNTSPVITEIGNQQAFSNDEFTLQLEFEDAENDDLVFDLVVAPTGMAIHPTLGVLSWTPREDQLGLHSVLVRATDERGLSTTHTFNITVDLENFAPSISSTPVETAIVGLPYQYRLLGQDANGDTVEFRLIDGPEGMAIRSEELRNANGDIIQTRYFLEWNASEIPAETPEVVIVAVDGNGGRTRQSFTLNVVESATNSAPTIVSNGRLTARIDSSYLYALQVESDDADPLSYTIAGPDGMTIDSFGIIRWTPDASLLGQSFVIEATVSDGRGGVDTQSFTVDVVAQLQNEAPFILSTPILNTSQDREYRYDIDAVDNDGDVLFYEFVAGPSGMSIDAVTGSIRWMPSEDQRGEHFVQVRVTDLLGETATQSFTLDIHNANDHPMVLSVPPTRAVVGLDYFYAIRARDLDGDAMTFEMVADSEFVIPEGMMIDAESGVIRWMPALEQIGEHEILVQVSDEFGAIGIQRFTLVVVSADDPVDPNNPDGPTFGNLPPIIVSQPDFNADTNSLYQYQVIAVDADGDAFTFELVDGASGIPAGMSIDTNTGLISWTPDDSFVDSIQQITVRVTDSRGASGTQTYQLEVIENQPPVIVSTPVEEATAGAVYRYTVQANDPENGALTFELEGEVVGITIDNFGRIIWQVPNGIFGETRDVTVNVTDSHGQTVSQSFTINIREDETPPAISVRVSSDGMTFSNNLSVDEGTQVFFLVSGSDNVGVEQLGLTVNGVELPIDINGFATFFAETAGTLNVVATAIDAAGNQSMDTTVVIVADPSDQNVPGNDEDLPPRDPDSVPDDNNSPDVELLRVVNVDGSEPQNLPNQGEIPVPSITRNVDIIGTVDDPEDNLWYYEVLYARGDQVDLQNLNYQDPDWISLAIGDEEVIDGKLAEFDPTLIQNNQYVIIVVAFDNQGNGWVEPTVVNVEGNLKIGNFRFEVTDLSLSLAAIPIEVTRVYDTIDAPFENDFGFGWTLGIQDGQILETSVFGQGSIFNPDPTFIPGQTKVYLTDPDGQRIGFTYREEFLFGSFAGSVFRPFFEADAGVYSDLQIETTQIVRGGLFGDLIGGINPDSYTLVTTDGLEYQYDQFDGLQTITDLNGNVVTFEDDSISHSSGESIQILRDGRGRINQIIDPSGNSITYQYNAAGDLISFTNQAGLETLYSYQTEPAHFIESATNPNGQLAFEVQYDEETGEFNGVFDADGNQIDSRDNDLLANTAVIRDGNGNLTTLIYNDRGNVTEEIDADGNTTFREYNDPANPDLETRIIDRRGNITEREYDSRGNVIRITELGSVADTLTEPVVTEFTYDNQNRVTSITNALNQITTFAYDNRGNLILITNALGDTSSFTYDDQGRRTSFTDFNGNVTAFEYEGNDQPSRVNFADGTYQRFEYNQYGQVTFEGFFEADDTLVEVTRTSYDEIGRVLETITGEGASQTIVRMVYDGQLLDYEVIVNPESLNASGDLTESPSTPIDERQSRITDFEYDSNDRIIQQTDAEGGVVHFRYDNAGNRTVLIDPVGNVTTWVYDSLNRIVEERDPLFWEEFVANNTARFNGLSDAEFADEIAIANSEIELLTDLDANTGADHVTATGYDEEGNRAEVIDRNGRRLEFEYDFANRLVEENWFSDAGALVDTLVFSYDAVGNLLTAVDLNVTGSDAESRYVFTYDELNRLESEDNAGTSGAPNVVLTYEYDAQGNVIRTQDNFGVTVDSVYDSQNRLAVRTWFDADGSGDVDDARFEMVYNAAGRMIEMRRFVDLTDDSANLVGITSRTYDLAGRSDELDHLDASGADISTYDYDYDFAGLVTNETRVHQLTEYSQDIVYSYDLTGQLTAANYSGQANEFFAFDANGNRESSSANGNSYETESGNRLTTDGEFTYEYDGQGNLILKTKLNTDADGDAGETTEYIYGHRNRLVRVTISSAGGVILDEVKYQYDALDRRIARSENGNTIHFVFNGDNVWADFNGAGEAVARYLFGDNIDQNIARFKSGEGTVWYLADRLGTIRDLVDANGQLVNHTEYEAFGGIVSQLDGTFADRFAFTGREFDSVTGDYYYRARFVNPAIGRFLSNDPIGFDGMDLNLYRLVQNNPVNGTDPTGLVTLIEQNFELTAGGSFANIRAVQGVGQVIEQILFTLAGCLRAGALTGATVSFFEGESGDIDELNFLVGLLFCFTGRI